jgi:integrase
MATEGGGARTLNRLSNKFVESNRRKPGMYADGGGLYLRIAEGGSKQWIFRYVTNGRLRDMGIGPCHTLTLAEARERATEARKLRLDDIDPIAHKRARRAAAVAAEAGIKTFRQCAEGFIADNDKKWTSPKHRYQWETTLAKYVYPTLGELPVASIDTPLVLQVIKPLWKRTPTTASRVLGRIENVLGWATVHHYRSGDNPARWQGLVEHVGLEVAKPEHHAALPFDQMPAFMGKLRQDTSVTARCLEFIVLTATRLGEALNASWKEIDLKARTWTIPADRMKAGNEHKVPLSDAAMAILEDMRAIRQSDCVFPGQRKGQPISKNTPLTLAKRLSGADVTAHGMRSTFKDWASECTAFPKEVSEMALAHTISNAVEAAYPPQLFVRHSSRRGRRGRKRVDHSSLRVPSPCPTRLRYRTGPGVEPLSAGRGRIEAGACCR